LHRFIVFPETSDFYLDKYNKEFYHGFIIKKAGI